MPVRMRAVLFIFPQISYTAQQAVQLVHLVVAAVVVDPRMERVTIAGSVELQAEPAAVAAAQVKQEQTSVPVAVAVEAAEPAEALAMHGPTDTSAQAVAAVVPAQYLAQVAHGVPTVKSLTVRNFSITAAWRGIPHQAHPDLRAQEAQAVRAQR